MTESFGMEGDTSSPWLILGASLAGVATVALTEMLYRSGLVKQDAALGLAFPLLFAIAVILVSRFVDDTHLDEDAVLVGEIGLAWANTNSIALRIASRSRSGPMIPRPNTGGSASIAASWASARVMTARNSGGFAATAATIRRRRPTARACWSGSRCWFSFRSRSRSCC